jgi:hypothetical protein
MLDRPEKGMILSLNQLNKDREIIKEKMKWILALI